MTDWVELQECSDVLIRKQSNIRILKRLSPVSIVGGNYKTIDKLEVEIEIKNLKHSLRFEDCRSIIN